MYPYKTNFAALPDKCNIAYIDEGKGEQTLLFIHGLANYALVWQKNIDYLKQFYRCVAIDLPGNGLSDKEAHPFSMHFFAECVFNFIEALQLKNVCLVGHSMGGQIAITALLNHPQCAGKLVLCAPAGFEEFSAFDRSLFFGTIHLRDMMSSEESLLRQTIENSFYKHHKQGESVIKGLIEIMKTYKTEYYRKMVEACMKAMLEEPVLDKMNKIGQPTLIVFGNHDAFIPNRMLHHTTTEKIAATGANRIPNARLALVQDCGHFVQWEKPEDVNAEIVKFLQ